MLETEKLDSRIRSERVTRKERLVGHLLAPEGAIILNAIVNGFINLYYTDVLKLSGVWGGLFLVFLPILSKVVTALFNVVFGHMIDRTKSRQGKARPWILISAPFLALTAVLAFWIPTVDPGLQLVWIIVSYNLYFSFAHSMYMMSHGLMVPLSTRDPGDRSKLSVLANVGNNIIAGTFSAVIFAMIILPILQKDPSLWVPVVAVFALASVPLTILEYFFTLERITMETRNGRSKRETVSFGRQLKALFSDRYWVMITIFVLINTFINSVRGATLIYYCNWVLGTYESGTKILTLVQMVGGLPMGFGLFLVLPLVRKLGKRTLTLLGLELCIVGNIICFLYPHSLTIVIVGQMIMSLGMVPLAYIFTSMFADVQDHVEWKNGFRCDGASSGLNSIVTTVIAGIAVGFLNLTLVLGHYVAPDSGLAIQISQTDAMQSSFNFLFTGLQAVGQFALVFLLLFFDLERHVPNIQKDILDRNAGAQVVLGDSPIPPVAGK